MYCLGTFEIHLNSDDILWGDPHEAIIIGSFSCSCELWWISVGYIERVSLEFTWSFGKSLYNAPGKKSSYLLPDKVPRIWSRQRSKWPTPLKIRFIVRRSFQLKFSRHTSTLVGNFGKEWPTQKLEEFEVGNGKTYLYPKKVSNLFL